MKLHVVMATDYSLDRHTFRSGPQVATYALVQGLARLEGVRVEVVTCPQRVEKDHMVEEGGVAHHYLASPRPKFLTSYVRNVPKIAARIRRLNPDLVHAKNSTYALAGLRAGYPTVLTTHGLRLLHFGHYLNQGPRWLGWLRTNWLHLTMRSPMTPHLYTRLGAMFSTTTLVIALRRVQALIVVSNFAADRIAGLSSAQVHFIENPVDQLFFEVQTPKVPGRLLLVGRVNRGKGALDAVRVLHRIVDRFPAAELRIAGPVTEQDCYEVVQEYIARHGLEERVRFLGLIDAAQLAQEYGRCSVLLMPSTHENSPNAIGQVMAVGRPVVAYDVGGISGRLRHEETGYLVPFGDVDAFADRVCRLLEDDGLRGRMGRRARQIAEETFNADVVARKTLAVYQEMLGTPRG